MCQCDQYNADFLNNLKNQLVLVVRMSPSKNVEKLQNCFRFFDSQTHTKI